ncbi:ABC transporter permease, partial [Burkholderia sp. Cy-647]|nr:ABC transporter permease [Burkholderia sp. Cy-647]
MNPRSTPAARDAGLLRRFGALPAGLLFAI